MARVNIFLSDDLLEELDARAAKAHIGRSEFVRIALTRFLSEKQLEHERDAIRRQMESAGRRIDELAMKLGDWDPVATIRRFRDAGAPAVGETRAPYRTRKRPKGRA